MKIKELLNTNLDIEVTNLNDDSRAIKEDGAFFCIKGVHSDGNDFVEKAISNGAKVIITEKDVNYSVPTIKVDDSQYAYSSALKKFYHNSVDELKIVSVTGTDGKTTVSEILYQLLNMYSKCGYIGTNGIKFNDFTMDNEHTTPMPDVLFKAMDEFNKLDCEYVSIESSSERLATHKMDCIDFSVSIFTNLTRDHLDYHKTMENYAIAKAMSFEKLKEGGLGIVNYDDPYKKYFIERCKEKCLSYSLNNKEADIYASNIKIEFNHLEFDINGIYGRHHITTNISGEYNVLNIMCAILTLKHFGYDLHSIIDNIALLEPIEARQLLIESKLGFNVMVDYGHTRNAIYNLFKYIKPLVKGRILAVYGAAGSRDTQRMMDVAEYLTQDADYCYFTIEDARYDDPEYLIKKMCSNAANNNYEIEIDRDKAIRKAITNAKENDLVVILGKGFEKYQVTQGKLVERPNDVESAKMVLQELENR